MTSQTETPLPSRWADAAAIMPVSLSALTGPAVGEVVLPLDLAWSGRRVFDLSRPEQRYLFHMTVLTAAVRPEHYTRWLNADLLLSEWKGLRLPRALRALWQERYPELEAVHRAESA